MSIEYPDLQPFYRQVFEDTVSDRGIAKEIEFSRIFLEEWVGNFLHPFGDDLHRETLLDNIFYSYLASQSNVFDWLCHSLLFGHYQMVLRELRTILENMFYMFYLDVSYKDKTVEEKFQILKEQELRGVKLHGKSIFKNSQYPNWEPSYELYQELCKYIHIHSTTSAKLAMEIAHKGFPEILEINYNKKSFLECIRAWEKIAKTSVNLAVDICEKLDVEISEFNPSYFENIW